MAAERQESQKLCLNHNLQEVYPKLRDWYLSCLRQRSSQLSSIANATPIAKIESDRLFIEKIVLESSPEPKGETAVIERPELSILLPAIWLLGNLLSFAYLLLAYKESGAEIMNLFFHATLGLLFNAGSVAGSVSLLPQIAVPVSLTFYVLPLLACTVLPLKFIFKSRNAEHKLQGKESGRKLDFGVLTPQALFFVISLLASAALLLSLQNAPAMSCLLAWTSIFLFVFAFKSAQDRWKTSIESTAFAAGVKDIFSRSFSAELFSPDSETYAGLLSALRNSLNLLLARERAIADFSSDLICAFDRNYCLLAVNPSCAGIIGIPAHDLIYRSFLQLHVEPELSILERILKQATESGSTAEFETRTLTGAGSLLDLSWAVEYSAREELYFATATDITATRKMERARKEYLDMITHDLRIPLTSILLGLENLGLEEMGRLSDKQKACISRNQENTARVISLLNELIDLEKSTETNLVLELTEFRIQDLMLEAAEQLHFQAEKQDVDIKIAGENTSVKADRARIERVLYNLLSNALKYSPAGSKIEMCSISRPGDVEVRISDEGPGIPAQLHTAIFERFVQLNLPSRSSDHSSGLGLAICKAFVEAHGSLIGVDSEVGNGACFWFTLARAASKSP